MLLHVLGILLITDVMHYITFMLQIMKKGWYNNIHDSGKMPDLTVLEDMAIKMVQYFRNIMWFRDKALDSHAKGCCVILPRYSVLIPRTYSYSMGTGDSLPRGKAAEV